MYHYLTYQTKIQDNGQTSPAENLRKVFISYRKSDNDFLAIRDSVAEAILDCMNVAIWKDTNLTPGLDYDEEIKKAISESDAIVLLLTEHVTDSSYIWEKEVALAQKLEKGIIPICVGISEKDLKIVDERLNHRHCIVCPTTGSGSFNTRDSIFVDNLKRALNVHIMDSNLVKKINQFFLSEKHKVSVRYLSYEQLFYMGCGYLSGIGTQKNIELSIPMLKSIIHGYGSDPEFADLKRMVLGKLFYHYVECNDPVEIREYALKALEQGNLNVIKEINDWYGNNRHLEILSDVEFRAAFYMAVKKHGLRENFVINEKQRIQTTMLSVRKVEALEKKKSSILVNGSEFYLTAQKNEVPSYGMHCLTDYTIYLMRDNVAIDCFEPQRSPGPGNALFLSYDPQKQTIQVLESDFDHYDVESSYFEYIYYHIFKDEVERHFSYVGSHKYASTLPYRTRVW